jgi:hypothetical protein
MTIVAPMTMMTMLTPWRRNHCMNSARFQPGTKPKRVRANEMLAAAATPYAITISARIRRRARSRMAAWFSGPATSRRPSNRWRTTSASRTRRAASANASRMIPAVV